MNENKKQNFEEIKIDKTVFYVKRSFGLGSLEEILAEWVVKKALESA